MERRFALLDTIPQKSDLRVGGDHILLKLGKILLNRNAADFTSIALTLSNTSIGFFFGHHTGKEKRR